jgi:hypothetical protein
LTDGHNTVFAEPDAAAVTAALAPLLALSQVRLQGH